jgi:hypothetical protein
MRKEHGAKRNVKDFLTHSLLSPSPFPSPRERGKFGSSIKDPSLLCQQRFRLCSLGFKYHRILHGMKNKGPTGKKPVGPKEYV